MGFIPSSYRIGVLGGGQLGKMLAQAASRLDLPLAFLDKNRNYPAGKVSNQFFEGDFNCYEDVLAFGRKMTHLTVEIEHIHIGALKILQKEGIHVFPQAEILELIKDKGKQKQYYLSHKFSTAPFQHFEDANAVRSALESEQLKIPFVQKLCQGGYDGRGVQVVRNLKDLELLLDGPSIVEPLASIDKELSVIAVRTVSGECKTYPAVSMEFHPEANLVEDLVCPAEIPDHVAVRAQELAKELTMSLGIVGLLAVEFFYNHDGSLWVNEIAPRPHNSGHHTLDNGAISQFENHLRAMLDLPIGDTNFRQASVMINLLGDASCSGAPLYSGFEEILRLPGVHVHLYGKMETRPFRKMGHINVTGPNLEVCKQTANYIKKHIKVLA